MQHTDCRVMLSGETRLTVDGRDRGGRQRLSKLSDGTWHRIDIFQHRKVRTLVVDLFNLQLAVLLNKL